MKHYFTLIAEGTENFVAESTENFESSGDIQETIAEMDGDAASGTTGSSDSTEEAAKQQGSPWTMWIMLALIFGVMWFFMIRPQKKQQTELQKFRDALKRGDKVVTIGGIYGTVVEIKDASVLIEVDNGVKIRVSKQALIKDFSESQQ